VIGFMVDLPLDGTASADRNVKWIIFNYKLAGGTIDKVSTFTLNNLSLWGSTRATASRSIRSRAR